MRKMPTKQSKLAKVVLTDSEIREGQKITVVIPAFNEEMRIGQTIRELENNISEILEIRLFRWHFTH